MAIYHLHAKVFKRSAGQSSTAAAAYRSGTRLVDERTGLVHDYERKTEVGHTEVIAPKDAPSWAHDRATLWNVVEATERRKDAQLAREIEVALPHELSPSHQIDLVREYVGKQFTSRGMVADVSIHKPEGDNPHAHIMLTMRNLKGDGFGPKEREWNKPELLNEWRASWSATTNRHLDKAGIEAKIDHRSFEDRGIEQQPQIHHGNRENRKERNQVIIDLNEMLLSAKLALRTALEAVREQFRPTAPPEPVKIDTERLRAFEERQGSQDGPSLDDQEPETTRGPGIDL